MKGEATLLKKKQNMALFSTSLNRDRSVITAHANIPSNTRLKKIYPRKVMQTRIGKGVWVMPNVIIAPGVTIGDEAVLATGAVVTKDVPPRCLAAGVPAKVVKDFSDHEIFKDSE